MTSIQWLVGEKDNKLVLVLSVRRNLDEICIEGERKYREALKSIKDIKQDSFKLYKHYIGPSVSRGDRLYLEERVYENGEFHVNGVHYFVYEASHDKKKSVLERIEKLNSEFRDGLIIEEPVHLEKHCISDIISLYRT